MRTHIDWVTFTVTPEYFANDDTTLKEAVAEGIATLLGNNSQYTLFNRAWVAQDRSRAPYTNAWVVTDSGMTIFASPNLTHATVEISGAGCEQLIERDLLNELLTKCRERVTRIDIATDIETDVMPTEFVSETSHERMRSSGYQKSETGETCYVGSQKSDRYARVYRYFEPHPRHKLLRVEAVFRRDYAKAVIDGCLGSGEAAVAKAAGEAFGFTHRIWKPDLAQSVDISVTAVERKMGGTVFWLIKSCAPAFKRLCEDGTIRDPEAFFRTYFLSNKTK